MKLTKRDIEIIKDALDIAMEANSGSIDPYSVNQNKRFARVLKKLSRGVTK